ncbi:MAG TPA: hypothetical protein VK644_10165 [Chitinophagaceae bacterium]|nr:hypothetical protein [Chitinophagaceae bacterium]
MRKWLIALLVLLLVAIAIIYLFIPDTIRVQREISFTANDRGVRRTLLDRNTWTRWWPATDSSSAGEDTSIALFYHNHRYIVDTRKNISPAISILDNGVTASTSLNTIPLSGDSLKFSWEGLMITSYNPFSRVRAWFRAKDLKQDMDTILEKMKNFYINPENIYGIFIRQEKVVDSFLVTTTAETKTYPDIPFIYALIDRLKQHVGARSGKITGYPMMNVSTVDSLNYLLMVALPIDRELAIAPGIVNKKMMTGAKVLTTEVMGGSTSINHAYQQVSLFVNDYRITAPAIPFFSLITDRTQVDTGHWVTKVVFPIM